MSDTALGQIITPEKDNRKRAEQFAIGEATAYLNFRYDTKAIFDFEVLDYSQAVAYQVDQIIISSEGIAYTCIANAPVGASLTDGQYFEREDGRSELIVMIVTDLTAYHLFSRVPNHKIPQHISERYEAAIKKLKEIRAQKMNPELPLKSSDDSSTTQQQTNTISIISHQKRNNYW